MAKRGKQTNSSPFVTNMEDRISNLPTTLLHHILSFLPCHNLIKTCILSKNWRNIWFSVPSLYISNEDFWGDPISITNSFGKYVGFLLLSRGGSNIHKFSLSLALEPDLVTEVNDDLSIVQVNAWILNALRHHVEIVDISSYMSLTPLIFTCESLRELKLCLKNNKLELPTSMNLPSLEVLHLSEVVIQDGQLGDVFFSAMPCLKTLSMHDCQFSESILSIVSIFKLTTLNISGSLPGSLEISISAPNLKFFRVGPCWYRPKNIKLNCVSLVDAYIDSEVSCSKSMIELFAVLRNTSSLKLSVVFLESLTSELQNGMCILDCIQTPFHNLTHLELGTQFNDAEALVINNILYNCPRIEVIILKLKVIELNTRMYPSPHVDFGAEEVWSNSKLSKLSHLKLVEIHGFTASESEIKFVKILLENALVLEDLVITTTRPMYGSRYSQAMKIVGKEILQYPRASANAVILFA